MTTKAERDDGCTCGRDSGHEPDCVIRLKWERHSAQEHGVKWMLKCEALRAEVAALKAERDDAVRQRDHVRKNLQDATLKCFDARGQRDAAFELLSVLRSCSGCMVAHGDLYARIDALLSPQEQERV